jgi:hypothetical protein
MNKKDYQKPTMKVVKLQHRSHIMAGSEVFQAQRRSYGTARTEDGTEETWQ